eukprot:5378499-Amphidinium_carterae.1
MGQVANKIVGVVGAMGRGASCGYEVFSLFFHLNLTAIWRRLPRFRVAVGGRFGESADDGTWRSQPA